MSEPAHDYEKQLALAVDEQRLQHNLQGVRLRQQRQRERKLHVRVSLATAACVALMAWGATWRSSHVGTGPVVATTGQSLELQPAAAGGLIPLSDGSRLYRGPNSRLEWLENTGERVHSVLKSGWVRFEIKPGGPRRWVVNTGIAEVEVVGTAFTVARSPDRVRVAVHRGRVLVRGTQVPDGITQLAAGEHIELFDPATERAQPMSERLVEPAQAVEAHTPTPPVARGASALERADTLRMQRKFTKAAEVLARALKSQNSDPDAGLIALTLAQLELDELAAPARAASHFAQAQRSTTLPIFLREQALARRVEALVRAGDAVAAQNAAAEYDRLYPQGSWTRSLQAWLEALPDSP